MSAGPDGPQVEAELFLNGIDPQAVRVQLYADAAAAGDGADDGGDSVTELTRVGTAPDRSTPDVYRATLSSRRPIGDYTARVLPAHAAASVPLECARIAWQR